MRLLFVTDSEKKEYDSVKKTESAFDELGLEVSFFEVPDAFDETSLAVFISNIRENCVSAVFSIGYYPQVSLACNVLGMRYISWITELDDNSYYDYSIKNECNKIYMVDSRLSAELSPLNNNIQYLPLAMDNDIYEKTSIDCHTDSAYTDSDYQGDIIVWTKMEGDVTSIFDIMPLLKDSSKGYIDSITEQWKSDLIMSSVYACLASYVKEDIESCYPNESVNLESEASVYDRKYFFKCIDGYIAYSYINELLAPWHNSVTLSLVTDNNIEDVKAFAKVYSCADIRNNNYEILKNYKIVVVFPDISDKTKITQDMWNMVANGIFILVPQYVDFDLFEDCKPDTFRNKKELDSKVMYYLSHEEERMRLALSTQKKALCFGTYKNRIMRIMDEQNEQENSQ